MTTDRPLAPEAGSVRPYKARMTAMTVATGLCLALVPSFFTLGPVVETRFFPVTTRAQVADPYTDGDGVLFHVRFEKLRSCEFIGLAWYEGDFRLRLDFEPDTGGPVSRPTGPHVIGPWRVAQLRDLHQTHAWAMHRCHPLWVTFTRFFGD